MLNGTPRWLCSGYDWPLHKDWLAYVGLVIVAIEMFFGTRKDGPWDLLGVPFAFAIAGWLLGAVRNFVRGYRTAEPQGYHRPRRGESG